MNKILVCGTHFTTAQAVIEKLLERDDIQIDYIGRKTTMEGDNRESVESRILPSLGVKFHNLSAGRLSRGIGWNSLISFIKIPIGLWQAIILVWKIRPDIVVSFGGYVSVPVVIAARISNIPVVLHEQTLISGLANRICGWMAVKIAISFEDGNYDFPKNKMVVTGNPIRAELLSGSNPSSEMLDFISSSGKSNKKILYITGGNQGAQAINKMVMLGLGELLKQMNVIWQTGDSKYENYQLALDSVKKLEAEKQVMVAKWFDASDVRYIYKNADLIICRGGINTLNEISYFGQRAIVIPYPYLYKNEQLVNGRYFEQLGYVEVILQEELTSQKLVESVLKNILSEKVKNRKVVTTIDASEKVVDLILSVLKNDNR